MQFLRPFKSLPRREMVSLIHIPDNAPFTPEQRQWLGGFLGKMLAPAGGAIALGAHRLHPRVGVGVDPEVPIAEWSASVIALLSSETSAAASHITVSDKIEESSYSKKHPFPSAVLANYNLNRSGSKQTNHVALSLAGSGIVYEAGDALGVLPQNPASVVDEIIAALPFEAGVVPTFSGEKISLREALISHYDIGCINKSIITKWQKHSTSPLLRSLVAADDKKAWEDFCWGRDLIDLALDHPADFTSGEEFVSVLKKLQPRLYSIASSPAAHPGEVHICVGIVRYDSNGRKRGGICSTYLSDRLLAETKPGVFIHRNNAFRLPVDGEVPVIMVGPGTGIAPFRAFLEERKATSAKGKNWLFFGNPHQATDFLYGAELVGCKSFYE